MHIVAALFVEDFQLRQGAPTRLDLSGVFFSMQAPSPVPVVVTPHLVALIWCPPDEQGSGIFEVVFTKDDQEVARNVSPFTVESGKFTYRLVRGELPFDDYGQVVARCRLDRGPWHLVPLTLLPPA
jgi:hypothetical protein